MNVKCPRPAFAQKNINKQEKPFISKIMLNKSSKIEKNLERLNKHSVSMYR